MKKSITVKYTLVLTTLLMSTVFLCWILNRIFLPTYYEYSKVNTEAESFAQIQEIIDVLDETNTEDDIVSFNSTSSFTTEQIYELDRICQSKNVSVYILTGNFMGVDVRPKYPLMESIGNSEISQIKKMWQKYRYELDYFTTEFKDNSEEADELLQTGTNYSIYKVHDEQLGLNYIDLVAYVNDNYTVFVRANYESMQENVALSSKFLAYIGCFSTVLGSAIMFLMSRKLSKPILQLNHIAKQMCSLDFEVKYEGNTEDEIGQLGKGMNQLSEKLESTISELKTANNELQNDIQKKTAIDEMRKEFLSNVTHELKTPIALIQGYAEGLMDNINDDQDSRDFYCEVIVDEANKMNNMVKKLLSLNHIEFGSNPVEFDRFDIIAVIKSVLASTDILMKQKEVTLHFEEEEPVYVWADEYLVEEVLTNYVSNAINHVSGKNIIEVKLVDIGDVQRICVFNTGENIPEEDIDKVWIKFFKVDKARTREYGGSGIGLSIVKAIMNSMNRDCGVVNRETGVEFWFELDKKN